MFQSSVTATHDGKLCFPAGDMLSCSYTEGNCHLKDDSVLIWEPDVAQNCRFIKVRRWKGHLFGNVWLTKSKKFALSFSENHIKNNDYGRELIVIDQEYTVDDQRNAISG